MADGKKHYGKFNARVVSVDDPEKKCRVKVQVYDHTDGVPTESLPWAMTSLPLGSRKGEGAVNPVQVGDEVWVEYIGGDSRRPLVVGSAMATPGGVVNLAPDVFGGDGAIEPKRTGDQPAPEPSKYYEDVCYKQNGSIVQMCRNGTFRVTQISSGSTVELMPDGTVIINGEKDLFISAEGNMLVEVNGNFERRVKGTMQDTSRGPASYGSSESSLNLAAATQGTMSGMGGLALKGDTTLDGRMDINGSGTASGDWLVGGANSNHHGH